MGTSGLTRLVKQVARELGFDLVGIAPAGPSPDWQRYRRWLDAGFAGEMAYLDRRAGERTDLRRLLPEARSAILLGASHRAGALPATLRDDPSRGLIASYAWADDYHDTLKPRLHRLDAAIRLATGRATLGYANVDSGPVLERSWATAAGLGFIGKNTCLIAPRVGSWLFLATLLVPEELEYDRAVHMSNGQWLLFDGKSRMAHGQEPAGLPSGGGSSNKTGSLGGHRHLPPVGTCGACTRCLDVCPTQAFVEPHVLDARRCISYLTIELRGPIPRPLRPLMGNWIFGCDLCQQVCPWNRRYARPAGHNPWRPNPEVAAPPLLELLTLDEAGFRARFRRSPVKRSRRRGLLRNVCVALGNWGSIEAVPGLAEALHDEEPLVRGHAAWALGRIADSAARLALTRRAPQESDDYVKEEIEHAQTLAGRYP